MSYGLHRWIDADDIEVGDILLDGSDSHANLVFAERVETVDLETSTVNVLVNVAGIGNALRYRKGSTVTVLRGL